MAFQATQGDLTNAQMGHMSAMQAALLTSQAGLGALLSHPHGMIYGAESDEFDTLPISKCNCCGRYTNSVILFPMMGPCCPFIGGLILCSELTYPTKNFSWSFNRTTRRWTWTTRRGVPLCCLGHEEREGAFDEIDTAITQRDPTKVDKTGEPLLNVVLTMKKGGDPLTVKQIEVLRSAFEQPVWAGYLKQRLEISPSPVRGMN